MGIKRRFSTFILAKERGFLMIKVVILHYPEGLYQRCTIKEFLSSDLKPCELHSALR